MAARRLRALVAHTQLASAAPAVRTQNYAEFAGQPIDVDASRLAEVAGSNPLSRLAAGEIPAIILRNTLPAEVCRQIMQRFHEAGQFPPSFLPFLDIDIDTASAASAIITLWAYICPSIRLVYA